ncbi:MAG: hypothetical protein LBT20_00515 [Clostridiales bacterium]|jgi:hypothetical protein|nr:hypothetical protein [Clostridiales bacterium]
MKRNIFKTFLTVAILLASTTMILTGCNLLGLAGKVKTTIETPIIISKLLWKSADGMLELEFTEGLEEKDGEFVITKTTIKGSLTITNNKDIDINLYLTAGAYYQGEYEDEINAYMDFQITPNGVEWFYDIGGGKPNSGNINMLEKEFKKGKSKKYEVVVILNNVEIDAAGKLVPKKVVGIKTEEGLNIGITGHYGPTDDERIRLEMEIFWNLIPGGFIWKQIIK